MGGYFDGRYFPPRHFARGHFGPRNVLVVLSPSAYTNAVSLGVPGVDAGAVLLEFPGYESDGVLGEATVVAGTVVVYPDGTAEVSVPGHPTVYVREFQSAFFLFF